ncbi:hypothetical protein TWF751_003376 [Orbilia oligospora]|nr:hypothetical protein TWF751_003376 [Orbilia oligospora]
MALRQITRATCRHINRPTLSLLSIYTQTPASTPPSFLLPSSHGHGLHPTTCTTTIQRRNAVTNARFPVAPNLGPQFINEVRVRFPYDDEITAYNPTYIDETGALVGVYPIDQILRAYDRNKYHLIHISGVDRLTDESEGHIVRLFPKSLLLERLEAERRAEHKNDLNTHLKKIGKFLEKGNTVEVMIARKKKQAKPPQAKLDEMMEIIEEFMYYNGGVDLKKRSGEVGTQLTMVVQRPDDWVQPPPRPKKEVEEDEPIDEVEFEKLQKERQERIEIEQGGRVQEVAGEKKHVPAWQARGEVS